MKKIILLLTIVFFSLSNFALADNETTDWNEFFRGVNSYMKENPVYATPQDKLKAECNKGMQASCIEYQNYLNEQRDSENNLRNYWYNRY